MALNTKTAEEIDNSAAVLELYAAINRRDSVMVHRLLAPDLEWWFHGPPAHQHLKRLLTGEEEEEEEEEKEEEAEEGQGGRKFQLVPSDVVAFGSIIIAEGCFWDGGGDGGGAVWVHAWTVGAGGVITQVREYSDTSLTVTRVGGGDESGPDSTGSTQSWRPVWESRLHQQWSRKSIPGLVIAI